MEKCRYIENGEKEVDMLKILSKQYFAYIFGKLLEDALVPHIFYFVWSTSGRLGRKGCARTLRSVRKARIECCIFQRFIAVTIDGVWL